MFKKITILFLLLLTPAMLFADTQSCLSEAGKPIVQLRQSNLDAAGPFTMTNDKVWHIVGRCHVKVGDVLFVEKGTIIKGGAAGEIDPSVLEPSALIVDRDGYAEMIGTECCPIVMTYMGDDTDDPNDMPHGSRGLWGGLIVLGRANIGVCSSVPGVRQRHVEGIPVTDWDYALVEYGCDPDAGQPCDDNDNSGIFQYISIRHGGTEIGEANEINGLTMGAVGDGTTIDHIEVYCNLDDGFEWFGGTVNCHHLVAAFGGDDGFDYDEGYRGYGQFWFTIGDGEMDNAGEHDGNAGPVTACPWARPDIANVTYMGPGPTSPTNQQVLLVRDNAGGHYDNSVWVDFPVKPLNIQDVAGLYPGGCVPGTAPTEDSERRLGFGDLTFGSIFMYNMPFPANALVDDYVFGNCNLKNPNNSKVVDPLLISYPPTKVVGSASTNCRTLGAYTLCPRPASNSPVLAVNGAALYPIPRPLDGPAYPGDNSDLAPPAWFQYVPYAGAFAPDAPLWTDCWTFLDFGGYTGCPQEVGEFRQSNMDATGTFTLTNDKEWNLIGRVHVKAGQTLFVEEGTVIKGGAAGEIDPSVLEPSALIVDRDGYAEMIGTAEKPIIMTYVGDDVNDPNDMPHGSRGLWGGLIVLGRTNIGVCSSVPGVRQRHVEGIPVTDWDYALVTYGCDPDAGQPCDDNDNSGIYQYISIRHGGTEIGEANEINGLTMGAVGDGTTIDHIEVYCNLDDSFEWFGGTVNCRYLVAAFGADDGFDYDEGFRGHGQFWFTIGDSEMDNAGEHDGNAGPVTACPWARPDIANVTYMGPGPTSPTNQQVLLVRDNAGGHYLHSIWVDFPVKPLNIQDVAGLYPGGCVPGTAPTEDSERRLGFGDLSFANIFMYHMPFPANALVDDYVFGNCNTKNPDNTWNVDPQLESYPPTVIGEHGSVNCRTLGSHTLCPRPKITSPVISTRLANLPRLPVDGPAYSGDNSDEAAPSWFTNVNYAGAFSPYKPLWTDGWTFVWFGGYTCNCPEIPEWAYGDANGSGGDPAVDIDDIVFLINFVFGGGPAPNPLITGDANCSGTWDKSDVPIDIDDIVYLINYVFGGGPAPVPCPQP